MAAVDLSQAIALKSPALYARAATTAAAWVAQTNERKAISPYALHAAASAEAVRQAAFYGGPMVRDKAIVPGRRRYLIGRAFTLTHARLGYAAGKVCYVIGAQEREADTVLTIVRRLD